MKAPAQLVVGEELYQNANAVFCQSLIHKEALEANLSDVSVINLGSSLWTSKFLNDIENIPTPPENGRAAIIEDPNPIKQQSAAVRWCEQNKIPYDLVRAANPLELARSLSEYEYFVFFPAVLETFSRVAVEAKMVGCKVCTNQLLGAASENWFKAERLEIISEMKKAPQKTYNEIQKVFSNRKTRKKKSDITVILNAYRRPYNLEGQIAAIRQQSISPTSIWLWVNDHEDNREFDFSTLDVDRIFKNDYNWKFYGRFAGALLADTEYVAIFDDDTIPGKKWFQNCLDSMDIKEGIMGSAGYIQTGPRALQYEPERCGWPARNEKLKRVDYVGHAWFFKREWLSYLWSEKPCTWDNGEDIHFSYTAQKYGNIQTYCPPHPANDLELHGSLYGYQLGVDEKATSNNIAVSHEQFFSERDFCIKNAIKGGWKTVYNISTQGG